MSAARDGTTRNLAMAESGAHLSSIAAAADSNLPSVFEVLAQESLVSTLKPALHHVFRVRLSLSLSLCVSVCEHEYV